MQQIEATRENGAERQRVEAVVETLATLGSDGESVAEVAHDARNMVTALGLYCDLLEEPGVLASPFAHYGNELRLVAAASRRLVEKLVALDASKMVSAFSETNHTEHKADGFMEGSASVLNGGSCATNLAEKLLPGGGHWADRNSSLRRPDLRDASLTNEEISESSNTTAIERAVSRTMGKVAGEKVAGRNVATGTPPSTSSGRWELMLAAPIQDIAQELAANQNLLAALAGSSIAFSVRVDGARKPVRLTGEDLTRVMVNLVKNAAEAMPAGGAIQIDLCEVAALAGTADAVRLCIEDSGPGIGAEAQESIFCSGYTTRKKPHGSDDEWPASRRGLGLAITRSIVEAAGGRIQLSSKAPAGARFEIELPVRRMGHLAALTESGRA